MAEFRNGDSRRALSDSGRTKLYSTSEQETGVVVGVSNRTTPKELLDEYLHELIQLAETAGVKIVHKFSQDRDKIDPATFIGRGKAEEIGEVLKNENIRLVLFDDDLSPVQIRNLEKHMNCKIFDRSGIILDIFARRAKSKEAMTQVELAQLQYMLPRLTRQWTHLSKQYGGVGTKGPGETQIETDRRAIRARISHLKDKLERIKLEREVQRRGRDIMTRVATVGYTNAGKSTLFRALTGTDVLVEDRLFATLDTTVRNVPLGPGRSILLSDTVGFIRKLPPHLIATFRSTLAEVLEADVILHVVDCSQSLAGDRIEVVRETLESLGAAGKPVLFVFNKIDLLQDRPLLNELTAAYQPSIAISAERGINLSGLKERITELMDEAATVRTLTFGQDQYGTVSKLRALCEFLNERYEGGSIEITVRVPKKNEEHVARLLASTDHRHAV